VYSSFSLSISFHQCRLLLFHSSDTKCQYEADFISLLTTSCFQLQCYQLNDYRDNTLHVTNLRSSYTIAYTSLILKFPTGFALLKVVCVDKFLNYVLPSSQHLFYSSLVSLYSLQDVILSKMSARRERKQL
jgi:hypothetical protein